MIIDMHKKELLLATTVAITGLGIITIGAVSLPLTNTTITADTAGSALYNLTIDAKPYPIKFNITGGILDTIAIDGDQAILLVNINASTNGGNLTIELPRDLIDSKMQSDADKPYLVYEDDLDRPMSFIESKTTEKARTLVITFNNEDDVIEIQGTEVLSKP